LINISTSLTKDKVLIRFKDNGMGIDLNKFGDQIFGPYKRFHLRVEGKGLGLFMSKTQREVLGGTIRIESELGTGTEFTVELPHTIEDLLAQ
jgi:signal transduction histidine kinase